MKWIYLLIAGALEITWAVAMKMSTGFTILIPSMFGVLLFHEKLSVPQVICVILIVIKPATVFIMRDSAKRETGQ